LKYKQEAVFLDPKTARLPFGRPQSEGCISATWPRRDTGSIEGYCGPDARL